MSGEIETTRRDGVLVMSMQHGKANALDIALCQALLDGLEEAVAGGAEAVVLTGSGGIFSAGVDLKHVVAGGQGYVREFLPVLRRTFIRLASFELPLVAAVNGHAIAGGFVLLAAADRAVLAEGEGRLGVNELLVGVPFPAVALELVRMRAGEPQLSELVLQGSIFDTQTCLRRRLVDDLVPAGQLVERSLAAAKHLSGLGRAFGLTKRQLRRELMNRIGRAADLDREVDAVWEAAETIERVRTYMEGIGRR